MAIKAKNMNVGGEQPPTPLKETKPVSVVSFTSLRNKVTPKEQLKVSEPSISVKKMDEEPVTNYIQKTDGELVRHINKKSHYLRDMLEISN